MNKNGFGLKTIAIVAALSVIAGLLIAARLDLTNTTTAAGAFWKESSNGKAEAQQPQNGNFVELAKRLSPSVVNISTTQVIKERPHVPFPEFRSPFDEPFDEEFKRFFNEPRREMKRQSLGSGFIINKDGYILTNQHVIENASEIIVTFSENKKEYKAEVKGQDQKLDIALIKITADEQLPVVPLGDSDALQIGEWALAIGNPFGLGGTVTAGIVSQKGRSIGAGPYDNFIQTDASINPGNSGGPLFNVKGEVVGINTAIIAGGQGIGFATPINMVKEILLQLKDKGRVTRGWIGVSVQELNPELAGSFGLKEPNGALISAVSPGEPAETAGLKAGDVIISFDGKPIVDLSDLPRTVAATSPGKSVEVKIIRDGKEKALTIKVGSKADEEAQAATADGEKDKETTPDKLFGMTVGPMTQEMAKKLGVASADGVVVTAVQADSPAGRSGIRRWDIIREIDRKPVKNMKDYGRVASAVEKKETALFLVIRGHSAIYVSVRLKGR
ncbi:MAG: DegQ family serine endoprotease [Deltaproteobacteria bacterium]|nr:DegQ family serine endoprotease [Deltaproteobacteria bacterium]